MPPRLPIALLGLAVAIVLADSSVVTIALPEILGRYDVDVETLAWALTSFNLALALAALPAAFLARRWAGPVYAVGAVVFASASLACALAPSFAVLVAGRTLQGVAGAAVVASALGLLAEATGADARAARIWALAGIAGAACGPAVGGVLTQLLGWEAIFVAQVPLALLAAAALLQVRTTPAPRSLERPHLAANAALLLVSGALVAALFLLVILLINGWRLSPLAAGIVVTVMPLAAIVAARLAGGITPLWARAASGVILVSGGLAALGWLPEAGAAWTVPPQVAIGAGLGLALSALTERALAGRSSQAVHGGWTLAARHAGVVLGLLLLTPIFTADLDAKRDEALAAGTAFVLDSRIPPIQKIGVSRDILAAVDEAEAEARVPDVGAVVKERGDGPAHEDLASALQDQLDRAATNAFSRSFLAAALLGLAGLVPILLDRRDVSV
ncbi:MAG TPA: MFS transporter [Gaiellaceae bacterium]|nr:MFS transporter [Gaiellaceae bacterium]